jgi:hypothetical protein
MRFDSMSDLIYIVRALLKRGPLFLLRYARESLAFDLRYGTDTHMRVPKSREKDADSERKDGVLYVASWTSVVRQSLAWCKQELGEEKFAACQFFDLGCGKGKALFVYGLHYYATAKEPAIGIEYERSLCTIATHNIRKLHVPPSRIAIHCDSALNIRTYMTGKCLIVYLYNPFQGETLRAVLNQIAPFPHLLIYVDPVERELLSAYGYKIRTFSKGRYHADTWLIASLQIKRKTTATELDNI